jgi:hypothetical protein
MMSGLPMAHHPSFYLAESVQKSQEQSIPGGFLNPLPRIATKFNNLISE